MQDDVLHAPGQFLVRVRKGNWEMEVAGPDKEFVRERSEWLIGQFNSVTELPTATEVWEQPPVQSNSTPARPEKEQTLNEFFRQFKTQTHLEKILILGYWLEMRQDQPHFTVEDIVARYKEAREVPPANVRRDIGNVVAKGFLRQEKGAEGTLNYSLTNSGIREVESKMPGQ